MEADAFPLTQEGRIVLGRRPTVTAVAGHDSAQRCDSGVART
jgi:hypothetical protein